MDLPQGLARAHAHGLRVVACTEKTSNQLNACDLNGPLVLILGAEGEGISPAILERVDERGAIPMAGSIGSLNVSVAAGIALHLAHAQRAKPTDKA